MGGIDDCMASVRALIKKGRWIYSRFSFRSAWRTVRRSIVALELSQVYYTVLY